MKKNLLLVALLSGFAGVASAASSVTLYGRVDVGYESKEIKGDKKEFGEALTQESTSKTAGNSRYGIRGNEDLGNGYAATFQLEGRFQADNGAKSTNRTFFDRESTVGVKTPYGHVRLGRSISALEQGISFIDAGRRYSSYSVYGENWNVATRHSNGLFYNYSNSGFSVGADVTTKGGYNDGLATVAGVDNTPVTGENTDKAKVAYGAFAQYKDSMFQVGLAYQDDGVKTAGKLRREYGIAVATTLNPVTIGLAYAQGKDDVEGNTDLKARTLSANVSANITANDWVTALYRRETGKTKTAGSLTKNDQTTRFGLGYVHNLSKRTSVYADVSKTKRVERVAKTTTDDYIGWDVAVRHNF